MTTTPRRNLPAFKVYCLPEEREQVIQNAKAAGLSASTYLLRVGLGYRITGILDHQKVETLARVNGDMGRLGGLLKLWLSDDKRVANFKLKTLQTLLAKIEATQNELRQVMKQVLKTGKG